MSDLLRTLNSTGVAAFATYLEMLRNGGTGAPPYHLLHDNATSDPLDDDVPVENKTFSDRFEFGNYLVSMLAVLPRTDITFNSALWSWLALYYFDQVCPEVDGKRKVLEEAVYILPTTYNYRKFYRHLVRTPWLAVEKHKNFAKVLLINRGGGTRSELFEQLAAYQTIFGNPTIIAGAYKLYYDDKTDLPKRGSSNKGGGTPRRLVKFVGQIDLTYDLMACSADQFVALLPQEFGKFLSGTKSN